MMALRSKFEPYSKVLAIQRLILETFAMVGSFSKRAALSQGEICSSRENVINEAYHLTAYAALLWSRQGA
jgi:hypothetical protein